VKKLRALLRRVFKTRRQLVVVAEPTQAEIESINRELRCLASNGQRAQET
jgi:hypothetical protein